MRKANDREQASTSGNWVDPDDAPDLSRSPWVERLAAAPVLRGRPHARDPKISTTIRLSRLVLEHFKAGGKGWQTRIDAALAEWLAARGGR